MVIGLSGIWKGFGGSITCFYDEQVSVLVRVGFRWRRRSNLEGWL